MSSPQPNGHRASTPNLVPYPDSTFPEPRGRDPSPRGGYGGRKGYNARPPMDFTPPASSHGGSPRGTSHAQTTTAAAAHAHRDGLFSGRKGYNGSPGSSPAPSRECSPSTSPRPDGTRGRKGYNSETGPAAVAMARAASHDATPPRPASVSTFRDGLSGHRSRDASPAHPVFRATSPSPARAALPHPHAGSPAMHPEGGLGSGRKGYTGSPRASPRLSPALESEVAAAGGYRGRKGYNEQPQQPQTGGEAVDAARRRHSPSPARHGDPHGLAQVQQQQLHQHHRNPSDAGLGIFHDGGYAGRKGYNSNPSSRGASPAPRQ